MNRENAPKPKPCFTPIGIIRTPYKDWAPYQPVERDPGREIFRLVLSHEFADGLRNLDRFLYAYVLYFLDRIEATPSMTVSPPWAKGKNVGLFAARSPARPNPIGLSVVRILRIKENEVITSPLDVFDETPLLDLKPYFKTLDAKADANDGWVEDLEDRTHLMEHLRGIPHHHEHREPGREKG